MNSALRSFVAIPIALSMLSGFGSWPAYGQQSQQRAALEQCARAYPVLQAKQYAEAAAMFERAALLDPNCFNAHSNLAFLYGRLNRREEALRESAMAIQLDPSHEDGYVNYVHGALMLNRIPEMASMCELYLKRFPQGKKRDLIERQLANAKLEMANRVSRGQPVDVRSERDNYLNLAGEPMPKWPASAMPLKVFVDVGTKCRGFKPEFEQGLIDAFTMWQQESEGLVRFASVTSPDRADIICKWTDDGATLMGEAGGAGKCTPATRGGFMSGAEIVLVTVKPSAKEPLTGYRIKATALHEIGHALGLIFHSDEHDDIMFCAAGDDVRATLSDRDLNTLSMLYTGRKFNRQGRCR